MVTFFRPSIFDQFPNLVAAQSTRLGGVSPMPYTSLNLGLHTDDHPESVKTNRRLFCGELGIEENALACSHQIHGDKIMVVDQPIQTNGFDALITNKVGVFLAVTIADCTPILVYHPESGSLAAIHAGWRGTVAKIVEKTLRLMEREYAINTQGCYAFIGACIGVDAYEVGEEVAGKFETKFKIWNPITQKFHVDLKAANSAQLQNVGVKKEQIEVSTYCTTKNNTQFFSHRAERGKTGRMLAVIGVRP